MNNNSKYVLVTPVKNEEKNLSALFQCVIRQTRPPARWVIVNDSSTDGTEELVRQLQRETSYIRLLNREQEDALYYASRVLALKKGIESLRDEPFDFLGILDADLLLPQHYYEILLDKFASDPRLGIAGGLVSDHTNNGISHRRAQSLHHVAGGVQMFRRQCYDEVGGYIVMRWGGSDTVAESTARLLGWRTRSFPEIEVIHRRPTGNEGARLNWHWSCLKLGRRDYYIGYHPLYFTLKCMLRFLEQPIFLASFFRILGFLMSAVKKPQREISADIVRHIRREQLRSIRFTLRKKERMTFEPQE